MFQEKVTLILVVTVIILLCGWNIYAATTSNYTISNLFRICTLTTPFFPFIFGALMGHCFIPSPGPIFGFVPSLLVLTGVGILVALSPFVVPTWRQLPAAYHLFGVLSAMLLWPNLMIK
jgi:hypothetical protein